MGRMHSGMGAGMYSREKFLHHRHPPLRSKCFLSAKVIKMNDILTSEEKEAARPAFEAALRKIDPHRLLGRKDDGYDFIPTQREWVLWLECTAQHKMSGEILSTV